MYLILSQDKSIKVMSAKIHVKQNYMASSCSNVDITKRV